MFLMNLDNWKDMVAPDRSLLIRGIVYRMYPIDAEQLFPAAQYPLGHLSSL
jgi:hypothetical protein